MKDKKIENGKRLYKYTPISPSSWDREFQLIVEIEDPEARFSPGYVVSSSSANYKPGDYKSDWNMAVFKLID